MGDDVAGIVDALARCEPAEFVSVPLPGDGTAVLDAPAGMLDQLEGRSFDLIVLPCTLRRIAAPRALLDGLAQHLRDDGTMVLEVDVARPRERMVLRSPDEPPGLDPTRRMLTERYLEGFAYRFIGRAAEQPEGRLDRLVFHASRRRTQVVIVTGASRDGKSDLVRQLAGIRSSEVHLDRVLAWALDRVVTSDTPLLELISTFQERGDRSVSQIVEAVAEAGLADELADLLCSHVPLDEPVVFIEGYGIWGALREAVVRRLEADAVVWVAERASTTGASTKLGPATTERAVELLKQEHARRVKRLESELERAREARPPSEPEPEATIQSLRADQDDAVDRYEGVRTRRTVRWARALSRLFRPARR